MKPKFSVLLYPAKWLLESPVAKKKHSKIDIKKNVYLSAVEPADPTSGMSSREKKMYELQQRLRQSRKANENAVIAEKRRQQVLY